MTRTARSSLLALGWLVFATPAHAAGGHFDVDDAAMVEPGHCQDETWWARAPAVSATLFHFGPGCRVGPVEIGLNFERSSSTTPAVTEARSTWGPQLKWVVDPLAGPLSIGVAWSAAFDAQRGGRPAHLLYVPLTWSVNDSLAVNVNVGADRDFAGARARRVGASGEWIAHERFTVIGERVKLGGNWTSRLGLRLLLTESISLDVSAARAGPRATQVCVIGLNHDFAR